MNESEAREKITKAIESGNVVVSEMAEASFANMDLDNPDRVADFTITDIKLNCWGPWKKADFGNEGGFEIQWETVNCGFGSTTVYVKDGKIKCDNEAMGKNFIRSVFEKLIQDMELMCIFTPSEDNDNV
jgi:hypothetical protein